MMEISIIEKQDGSLGLAYGEIAVPYLTGIEARQARVENMLRGIRQPKDTPTPSFGIVGRPEPITMTASEAPHE